MNQLYELREWLLDRIDGGEEMRGEDGLVSNFICQIDAATAELADLKQRLLPQFQGRAQRAEHERDALLEQLIAARSATAATDRPDWAQQLPGAEIFDRAARYEYIRTLNPRKFAALYNEALMGVHQFDDLVDRYRAKGKTVECGYDRSASLNAGKYVCTCGGACSHYDAGQSHSHHTTGEKP